jgi:hypothetical protein
MFLLAAVLILPGGVVQASGGTVEKIQVNISAANGTMPPPSRIAKRMADSVTIVGEHVILGRRVGEVADAKASYERIIKEVFDRILVGYYVDQVSIAPGPETAITVEVSPWGDVVREVALEVDYGGMSPEIAALVRKDMGNLSDKVDDALIGLPVDAVDWAGAVSKSLIQELLAAQLPDFRANIDITGGTKTVIRLSLLPAGATIQDVRISLQSHTIPNILLGGVRPAMEEAAQGLVGLPVAFVDRHKDYFTAQVASAAAGHRIVRTYGLTVTPSLSPGTTTEISVNADTGRYNIWLEGYLDMGRNDQDSSARLHAGQFFGSRDEGFVEVDFIPGSVTWKFAPGWSHRIGYNTQAGVKYDLSDKEAVLQLYQPLGHDWSLRVERTPAAGYDEIGLRYKIHDYISVEYIFTDDSQWLRLVGNL